MYTIAEFREILSAWDSGTYESLSRSIQRHYQDHGTGQGILAYTREARSFYENNIGRAREHPLRDGRTGLRIGRGVRYGIYTFEGRIISYGRNRRR